SRAAGRLSPRRTRFLVGDHARRLTNPYVPLYVKVGPTVRCPGAIRPRASRFRGRRQLDGECAALARRAADVYCTLVQPGDRLHNRQPRARALVFILLAVDLVKRLEDVLKLARGDAAPLVDHRDLDAAVVARSDADGHRAARLLGELDRVVHQALD